MDVPEPLRRVVPELASLHLPDEPLATCARCAMAPLPGAPAAVARDRIFTAKARCCTYHPRMANFLVGRALRRGGVGAERLRLRLQDPDGVSALGVDAGKVRGDRLRGRSDDDFGRNELLTCPYWVEGPLGCSVHADRESVCRTWFCKLQHGLRGQEAWAPVNVLLRHTEMLLAEYCRDLLPWDPADPASTYVAAADLVDATGDDVLRGLRTARTDVFVQNARAAIERRDAPMPDVLVGRLRAWERLPSGAWRVTSFSPFDPSEAPPWLFELLGRFDGVRTWREALDLAVVEAQVEIPADAVSWLWQRGLVGPVEDLVGPDVPVVTMLPS
jgi:hypothetical protein